MKRTVWIVGVAVAAMFAAGQGCGPTILGAPGGTTGDGYYYGDGYYVGDGYYSDGSVVYDGAYYDGYYDGTPYISCMDCACAYLSGDTPAGCADTCDNTISGAANPNFCNGANALSQCAQCIMDRCGESPSNCL
jgi:hypothetical protein